MDGKSLQYNIEDLYKWIDNYPITRQKRNISRDFSDAVPLAEILKRQYPKLVDLHNYAPRNSVAQKLINWQILNKKVLAKLNMSLSSTVMDQLSQSVPGVIEKVLFEVKERMEAKPVVEKQEGYYVEGLSASISGCVIPVKQKDSVKTLDHKVVPIDVYTNMENEIQEKTEIINTLTNKVQHLENLLEIKDERIDDLTNQIQKITSNNSGVSSLTLMQGGSKLFNKLF